MKETIARAMALASLLVMVSLGEACSPAEQKSGDCCKVERVDPKSGLVTVRTLERGELVEFPAEGTALQGLKVGQNVTVAFIRSSIDSHPGGGPGRQICRCGKRSDGRCWCVPGEPKCDWNCPGDPVPTGAPTPIGPSSVP